VSFQTSKQFTIFQLYFSKTFSLVKLQRKIYQANLALQYFILNNWHFENKNFIHLNHDLKLIDVKTFGYLDFLEYDLILYFRYSVLGARRYLLKEKDENLPKARRHFRRMRILDYILKTTVLSFLVYYVLSKFIVITAK
jgi:alcohol-forming fatty acyl-CoA reductase